MTNLNNNKIRFCSQCGTKLDERARFCKGCGKAIEQVQQPKQEQSDYNNIENEIPNSESNTQRKNIYDGEIHKCPNCGGIIDAFETICEDCGYEIRGRKAVSVVRELALKLENAKDEKTKDELIYNFYIPNTKEDIYDFFILAVSNIKADNKHSKAWFSKLEQAYQKAQLTLGDTREFEYFRNLYVKAEKANKTNFIFRLAKTGYAWAVLLIVIGGLLCFIGGDPEESGLTVGGIFSIEGGAIVAMLTMLSNSDKK